MYKIQNYMIRFVWPLAILACSGTMHNQHGFMIENKGLTCDAQKLDQERFIICGESSAFTGSATAGNKDGFCFIRNFNNSSTGIGFALGKSEQQERIEKIRIQDRHYFVSGYSGENKNKFVAKLDDKFNLIWARSSDSIQSTDQPELAVNLSSHILLAGKNSADESYQIQLHLFNGDGACLWSKSMPSVEILQDILPTKDQNFLISFKQKGAYIDGQTRKRYIMNSFYKINTEGQQVWAGKFHMDDDQVHHSYFTKVVEDSKTQLYFIGHIAFQANVENAYIVKTNSDGKILWSKFYVGLENYVFKSASIGEDGKIFIIGDGYGKNGGLVYASIREDGQIEWARKSKSANYEQAISVIPSENSFTIIWDKLFTMAGFSTDKKGNACLGENEELKVSAQEFMIQMERFKGRMGDLPLHAWKELDMETKVFDQIAVKNLCP
ncbi:MAG: hypothetical protein IPM92_01300 [Saprospiraceae bacterium]|nr:hypothetical protein [Saprospiraceae bacterium]